MKQLFAILIFIFFQTMYAEEPFWEYLYGPKGGEIVSIEVNERDDIFLCSYNGLFCSTDHGESWEWILKGGIIWDCAMKDDGTIIVRRESDSIGRSTPPYQFLVSNDYGKNWTIIDGLGYYGPNQVCVFKDSLYFSHVDEKKYQYIIKSSFDGLKWNEAAKIDFESGTSFKNLFVLDYGFFALLFYLEGDYYFYLTDDYFQIYRDIGNGIRTHFVCLNEFDDFVIGTQHGVQLSTDQGESWINVLESDFVRRIYHDNKNNLYAQTDVCIYTSTDQGYNWIKSCEVNNLCFNIDSANNFYIYYHGNIYNSTDKGENWKEKTNNYFSLRAKDLGADRLGNTYVTASHGIFKSGDNGITWEYFRPYDYFYSNLEVSKRNNLYLTYRRNDKTNGICYTTNQGKSWDTIPMDFPRIGINKIKVDHNENIFLATYPYSILRTTDMGQTWDRFADSIVWGYDCIEFNSEGHWFIGAGNFDLYRSTDEGLTWERQIHQDQGFGLTDIVFHPTNGLGYAGGSLGLYRTINNGRSWQKVGAWTIDLALDSAGYFYTGLARFKDDLSTSEPLKPGYMPIHYPKLIEYSPTGYIYSAAEYGGLYRSREPVVSVEETPEQPNAITLQQNSPNPFEENTEISYYIDKPAYTRIKLYNMLGIEVAEYGGGFVKGGWHTLIVNGSGLTNGVYIIVLEAGAKRSSKLIHKVR